MTLGELKELIKDLPDNLEVLVLDKVDGYPFCSRVRKFEVFQQACEVTNETDRDVIEQIVEVNGNYWTLRTPKSLKNIFQAIYLAA